MEENLWLKELNSLALDGCSAKDVYAICQGKALPETLRQSVWQVCLDVRQKEDQLFLFNEIFDLSCQHQIRQDCQKYVEKICNEDDKVSLLFDMESILTFYCKKRNLQYKSDNGWIKVLLPLMTLQLNRSQIYNLFEAILDMYISESCISNGNAFHLFRLLLLYHDPELCTMLDTKKISSDSYAKHWFQTLFASSCELSVIQNMWDFYFQQADPFLVFYLSLIILINGRDQILALNEFTKEDIIKFVTDMPCGLQTGDVVDFCTLAEYYAIRTPSTFKTNFFNDYYTGTQNTTGQQCNKELCPIDHALCLPVSVYELLENSSTDLAPPNAVRYFLVDCRPADQYNAGHLSTAFHLDCNLMLQEPSAFATAVQGLLNSQQQAIGAKSHAGGEHLCFMSSGRPEEDKYTHMVIFSFLQKNTQYVSMLSGGYKAVHEYFGDYMADWLEDHDIYKCIMCQENVKLRNDFPTNEVSTGYQLSAYKSNQESHRTSEILSRFSAAMKLKSGKVKEKLFDIITIPGAAGLNDHSPKKINRENVEPARHVLAIDRTNGRPYRNQPSVFSIDDKNEDSDYNLGFQHSPEFASIKFSDESIDLVMLNQYLKSADVVDNFKCQEVHLNGYMYDSYLIINESHLIVLREVRQGLAQMVVRRPLSSIVKITAKKRHRDLITFKYGFQHGNNFVITDMDRFLIPNASEATAIVSKRILQTLDGISST